MLKLVAPIGGWALCAAVIAGCTDCSSATFADDRNQRAPTCQRAADYLCSVSLLQASSQRFKEQVDGLPDMRQHPDKMSHGGEALIKALGNWWHPTFPWIGAKNGSAKQINEDTHVQAPNVQRNVTVVGPPLKIVPPLKEPAHAADKNFVHDKQPEKDDLGPETTKLIRRSGEDEARSATMVSRSMHSTLALLFLGFSVFLLGVFYLIEFPEPDAQQAFWRLLSTAVSVFVAVLIFCATQELIAYYFEYGRKHHGVEIGHRPPVDNMLVLLVLLRLIFFWIVLQFFFRYTDSEVVLSAAIRRVGTHLMAFAAVDFFGTLQALHMRFSHNWFFLCTSLAISAVFIWVWFLLAERFRLAYSPEDHAEDDQKREHWFAECTSAEYEAASLVVGVLLSQCVRYAISGHFSPLHGGSPRDVSPEQVLILLGIGVALGTLLVPAEIVAYELELVKGSGSSLLDLLRGAWSMTMAWCLLYWSKWAFWYSTADNGWGYGDKMLALLAMALILSAISLVSIFVIEMIADPYAREQRAALVALNTALGLVMGMAWETTFRAAVVGVGDLPYFSTSYVLNNIVLILALCAVVLPVWIIYIFPRAMPCRRSGSKWARTNEI